MAHDVFISYSNKDENVVRAVSNALETKKIRCWYASRDIPAGANWPTSIVNAIQEAQVLLLIFTDYSNSSKHVSREVNIAISDGKPVIPFKLTPNGPTDGMKYYLESVHWLDAVDQPLEEAIDKLVDRVKKHLDVENPSSNITSDTGVILDPPHPPHPPTPFPVKKWLFAALGVLVVAAIVALLGTGIFPPKPTPTTAPVQTAVPATVSPEANKQEAWKKNVLRADPLPQQDESASEGVLFGTYIKRSSIKTITFLDSLENMPANARDVSDGRTGNVMAWTKNAANGLYDLYIAADGGICAPRNCSWLFNGYTQLETINFNNAFHTDNTFDMKNMFRRCSSLKTIDLSAFKTSQVKDTSWMFTVCSNLKSLDLSAFDTSAVENMDGMFAECENLEKIILGNRFVTSNVESIYSFLFGCKKLDAIDVSRFDTTKIKYMDKMFCYCSALEKLDLSGFHAEKIERISSMFNGCSKLKELDLSGFNTANVTEMSKLFCSCSSLEKITFGDMFVTSKVTNMSYMFFGCLNLSSDVVSRINSFDTTKVTAYDNFMPDSLDPSWRDMFKAQ